MIEKKPPSTLAREALKLLNVRKLAPTPANYQASYNEIANVPNVAGFPEAPLREIALALTARNPEQERQLGLLDVAIGRRNWHEIQDALAALVGHAAPDAAPAGEKLPVADAGMRINLAKAFEKLLPALGDDDTHLTEEVAELLRSLRNPAADDALVKRTLETFARLASFAAEEQAEIRETLLKLLHLIIENIGQLSLDDSWLKGQIDALLVAVAPPLTLRRLDEVARRIRDVMARQTEAKSRSVEAQDEMRQMLAAFIERLSVMSQSSSTFQSQLEENARKIQQIKTVEGLAPLLKEVIGATRAMTEGARSAHDQLRGLHEKVQATEAEIQKLHTELSQASALARHDPLTDALNRKGLDEALAREIAVVQRKETPLSLALLDIDNFKAINDRLGHETGDEALLHLVRVARECMRPVDSLARYGGEEFVILMPDTTLDQGIQAMTRLQRKLTKTFFLAEDEKILITFSAGVAQLAAGESAAAALRRADKAMYLAKRAGKNRVLGS